MAVSFRNLGLVTVLQIVFICCGVSAFNLTILHTNDVHSRIEQTNKYASACSNSDYLKGKCYGGFARIKTKVDEIRNRDPSKTLFLDAGDQSQGTMWYYEFGGTVIASFMNLLNYDAMAVGNHEFDNGVAKLVEFINVANFPVLSSNLDMSREPNLTKVVSASTVLTRNNQKIGVVGYTTVETALISQPEGVVFKPVIENVQKVVDEFKSQGINKIIALGHAGFEMDKAVAKGVSGVDIVIGGHTNTFLYNGEPPSIEKATGPYPTVMQNPDGDNALVVQDFAYGKYLGFLEVMFDDEGKVTAWSGNPIILDNSTLRDETILAKIKPLAEDLSAKMKQVMGSTNVFLDGRREVCRMQECNLGNAITDGMVQVNLRTSGNSDLSDVKIAIINGGGIRAPIQKGAITQEDVLAVQPFRNTLDVIELTGETIIEALQFGANRWVPTGELYGGFLQVSGMRIVYDMRRPMGERVVKVTALCSDCEVPEFRTLNSTQVYKVIMPTFTFNGGDGYTMFKEKAIKNHKNGALDSTVFGDYIRHYSPLRTYLDGRISFLTDANDDGSDPVDKTTKDCPGSASFVTSSLLVLFLAFLSSRLGFF